MKILVLMFWDFRMVNLVSPNKYEAQNRCKSIKLECKKKTSLFLLDCYYKICDGL